MRLLRYSISLLLVIGTTGSTVTLADDDCAGAAVDAADSMNVNQKGCDYKDEGLNGVLHKAFKRGSEGAVLETTAQKSVIPVKSETALAAKKMSIATADATYFSLNVDVDQWAGVALARTQLLPKAMEKCPKGFAIQDERYRPLTMGRIELSIAFSCLD